MTENQVRVALHETEKPDPIRPISDPALSVDQQWPHATAGPQVKSCYTALETMKGITSSDFSFRQFRMQNRRGAQSPETRNPDRWTPFSHNT